MAVEVVAEGGEVVVRIRGWDVLWAFSRGFRLPVAEAEAMDRAAVPRRRVLRWLGTYFPGVIEAGRFGWFWNVTEFRVLHLARRVLVLTGAPGARYERVLLQVGDPDAVAAQLNGTSGRSGSAGSVP